jgi:hypothetical protein
VCYEEQKDRKNSVEGILKHAIMLLPDRPEAYFYLSRFYERTQNWFEGYFYANLGAQVSQNDLEPLLIENEYPGKYGLLFEKAVCSWHCSLPDVSKNTLLEIMYHHKVNDLYKNAIRYNFDKLGFWRKWEKWSLLPKPEDIIYDSDLYRLKVPFKNQHLIDNTYSEFLQDLFVLTSLKGKQNGTYLEIGSANAFYGNNTALLEKRFGWKGLSIDYTDVYIEQFFQFRNNRALLADATQVDYNKILQDEFGTETIIDYLQIDLEPPSVTLYALRNIPFDKYKFRVITFEHDHYKSDGVREQSRKLLSKHGYKLVVANVGSDERSVEDWWIHPDLVDYNSLFPLITLDKEVVNPKTLFFK